MRYRVFGMIAAGVALAGGVAAAALAQVETIDPNKASSRAATAPARAPAASAPAEPRMMDEPTPAAPPAASPPQPVSVASSPSATYQENDVLSAAEGVFGKGAKGLAEVIERTFKKQGRPNAYIAGREAGGAFIAGIRYGSGTLVHKIEGERPVYWQGPSLGFDFGASGAKTFVLVYNLYDTQDLYRRFPAVEGSAFVVGGFQASYLQRGNVILVPIRLGVGLRLGANLGYMKFTQKKNVQPF